MMPAATAATPTPAPIPALAPVDKPPPLLEDIPFCCKPAMPVGLAVLVTTVVEKIVVAGIVVCTTVYIVLWLVTPSGCVVTITLLVE